MIRGYEVTWIVACSFGKRQRHGGCSIALLTTAMSQLGRVFLVAAMMESRGRHLKNSTEDYGDEQGDFFVFTLFI